MYIIHGVGTNDTIRGAIKKYNRHDLSEEKLLFLIDEFNKLNSFKVPKLGDQVKIPIKWTVNGEIPEG